MHNSLTHEEKLDRKQCTWSGCDEPGVFYSTDDSEPYGLPLLHCAEHEEAYRNEIQEELDMYKLRG